MSSRMKHNKHFEQTMSERNYAREEMFGRSGSPYKNIDELSVEFSFKQMDQSGGEVMESSSSLYKSQSIISLKQNLQNLPKQQIIELLLEEINSSQGNPAQRQKLNQTLKDVGKFKREDKNYKKEYDELVRDFQEYINNTRQAQQHYVKIIDDLKKQNKSIETQLLNKKTNESKHSQVVHSPHSHSHKSQLMIQKQLEDTVQNYIQINDELLRKIQELQRLNKDITEVRVKENEKLHVLKEESEFMNKENQKLKKQNSSFKSIIDQLKDYIMARREAKQNQSDIVSITSRSNKSQKARIEQMTIKNQFIMPKYDDSIIQSSQIKRREHTLNDSTIMFEKDSHGLTSIDHQNNKESQQIYAKQHEDEYDESMHTSHIISTQTLVIIQNQNKELKMMNERLEGLLEKKSERINMLLQENESLKSEISIANEEILQLKLKAKRNHTIISSYDESITTTASRCTTNNEDLRKSSTASTPKEQFHTKTKKLTRDPSHEGFIKRHSHCTESGFKTQQHLSNFEIQEQDKPDENRFRKSFNLEQFNFLKGQTQYRSPYHEKKVERNSQQYCVPQTLNASNKKF